MNQCQGCQAGWPIEYHKLWPKGIESIPFHYVKGGYKNEKIICTKDRYKVAKEDE